MRKTGRYVMHLEVRHPWFANVSELLTSHHPTPTLPGGVPPQPKVEVGSNLNGRRLFLLSKLLILILYLHTPKKHPVT